MRFCSVMMMVMILATWIVCVAGNRCLAQSPQVNGSASQQVWRVLSYNIHHAEGVDGRLDLERIANIIREVQPDIVSLQEVDVQVKRSNDVDQAASLATLTKCKFAFGGNIKLQGGQYGNAVLTPHELTFVKNHPLPNIDQGEQRGVLEVTVKRGDQQVRVLATHFDHRPDPRERMESIAAVNKLVEGSTTPSLLIGDLNAPFDSPVLKRATEVWQLTNQNSQPTIPVKRPERQIDFILCFPKVAWQSRSVTVLNEQVASDHRPIMAELFLGK